ncbi:acetoacetate decarboxylase family protein [Microbispora sp. RL4-1S]|uniref:Acetoacetate decarboxylase family protein n=1 Tax=Microbispora oryzae TaxID=2806554 RepID=A0A940WID1_9ACTN|nr:acetoacetate decarboxylase family protein [Microbispora oryzae]MBP2706066.1 acetoacetate decarboxylase family protein [Microbispora oryzae]
MASHHIHGRRIDMPVEVRDASMCGALYLVRADAARAVLAYSGMDVVEVLPGKAVCVLVFVRYHDSDLDAYDEFGVVFLVRRHGTGPAPRRGPLAALRDLRAAGGGAFIHWLPVNQGFTMEAGRSIWGFPKELADLDLRLGSAYKRCILRRDGRLVVDLLIRPGMPLGWPPFSGGPTPDAYAHRDGVTRRIPWRARPRAVRWRPGGALIRLGNHPIAKELSELGLPKRALLTVSAGRLSMSFAEPESA